MGLLDWLTEGTGFGGGGSAMPPMNPMGDPTGGSMPQLPPGMPPMQGLDLPPPPISAGGLPAPNSMGGPAAPPMPPGLIDNPMGDQGPNPQIGEPRFPQGGDPMAGMGSGPGPGLPPPHMPPGIDPSTVGGPPGLPPGIPMPAPRPPGAGAASPPTDVSAARAPGGIVPPNPPPVMAADTQSAQSSMLGRALGLSPNGERSIFGGLGAGLKAAGNSSGKTPFQALASGAGETIEGAQKGSDKTIDQQDKYLARAIAAKKEGNNAEYQKNYLQYQIANAKAKLEASKEKAAGASVMNSPEQLYLRAIGATNQDGGLKILANKVRETQKLGPDTPEAKAAMAEYEKKFKEVRDGHLGTLGVDPSKIKGLESKPGFSDKNPVKDFPKDPAAAQKAFDALPEGAYFINPKDGRLLTKKSAGGGQQPNPAQSAPGLTPPIAPIPSAPTRPLEEVE